MRNLKKRVLWIIVGSVFAIGVVAGALLPILNRKERFTELDRNMMRLKTLATAVRAFAIDTDSHLPTSLRAMVPSYLSEEAYYTSLYRDPATGHTKEWLYYGEATKISDDAAIILASPSTQICPPHLVHHRIIGHRDTVVEVITDEEFQRKLADETKSMPR